MAFIREDSQIACKKQKHHGKIITDLHLTYSTNMGNMESSRTLFITVHIIFSEPVEAFGLI